MRLPCFLAVVLALCASSLAAEQARETLDRGLIARPVANGKVYLSWRLLESDPSSVAFNVYRRSGSEKSAQLNPEPIVKTTDFLDTTATEGTEYTWLVKPVIDGQEVSPSGEAKATPTAKDTKPYISIRLDGNHTFQKVGIADLDGDRKYDFVIKQPKDNIDPWHLYWKPSPETYKLEAYTNEGRFLWRYDLGWAIERGIWYSPYVVYDLDGDGKAEVAVKTGEGDPRDAEGKVQDGPEYLTILNGQTGQPLARVEWPSREGFKDPHRYNYFCRNQIGVAYLDGKRPSLIAARGTYNIMKAVAYQFNDGTLHEQWRWDNGDLERPWQGQGAHWMHAADVDADGRDEVLLGSVTLDENGKALWSTGLGHPDHFYLGDIDPDHPGLEIYYGIETRGKKDKMCLVNAKTGAILWGHNEPTTHIHSSGLCSDIDAKHPGSECYSGERDFKDKRWLRDCKGNVLSTEDLGGLAPRAVYWDGDLQRELLIGSQISDYPERKPVFQIEGQMVAVADILGDWREEIITSLPGELRIYVTTIRATDRRPCLMQDPIYRNDVIHAAMGYYQVPMISYDLTAGRR